MSVDLLERATRALRSTSASSGADERQIEQGLQRLTRARHPLGAPRRSLRTVAWTLAATFVGMGAWANATGRLQWFAPEPPAAPPALATPPSKPTPPSPNPPAPPPPAAAPSPPPASPAPSPPASAPPARARPQPPAPVPASPDSLYREAHTAHFNDANYAIALAAWDRYLAAAEPGHRWRTEARFNRAVALFRLGQTDDARRALTPFAEGEYGNYRRDDARRLLAVLEQRDR
jgi:hypothetical protein